MDSNFQLEEDRSSELISGSESVDPDYAGFGQTALLSLVNCTAGTTYFIALRAVDKALKISRVSNIASFYVAPAAIQVYSDVDEDLHRDGDLSLDVEGSEEAVRAFYLYSLVPVVIGVFSVVSLTLTILVIVMKSLGRNNGAYTSVASV